MIGPPLTKDIASMRDAYLESACRAEGYVDLGPLDFIEPLEVMLEDLVHRAHLTPFGRLITRYYLKHILRMRLKIQHAPDAPLAINRPIFILGLPRTGTTLVHELLSQHPNLRAPSFHESRHYPHNDWRDNWTHGLTHTQLAFVDIFAPTFKRIHGLKAHGPHECVTIQGYALRSMQFHVAFRLPKYNQWMMSSFDWQPAYAIHARYLGQLQRPGQRWILKAPSHMLSIDALLRQYPDAIFVQTHREPLEVIPSMASLTYSLRHITSNTLDTAEIGKDVNALWFKGIHDILHARQTNPDIDGRFIDIHFRDLIDRPIEVLTRIADFAGLAWEDEYTKDLHRHINRNQRHHKSMHTYTLAQFQLDENVLRDMYSEYRLSHLG